MQGLIPDAYAPFARSVLAGFSPEMLVTNESDVAEVVVHAARDVSDRLRFPAGADASAVRDRRCEPMDDPLAVVDQDVVHRT